MPIRPDPDQEQQILRTLLALGTFERRTDLEAEGTLAVGRALGCSPVQAQAVMDDLRERGLLDADITRGGELDVRTPMPSALWHWVRPTRRE
jgi:hypothetical protein